MYRVVLESYVGLDGQTYIRLVRYDWRIHDVTKSWVIERFENY